MITIKEAKHIQGNIGCLYVYEYGVTYISSFDHTKVERAKMYLMHKGIDSSRIQSRWDDGRYYIEVK